MKKKKRFSPLKFLLILVCIFLLIASAAINVLFTMYKVPKIGNRYIYIVEDNNPLGVDVTDGAALLTMDATDINLAAGDIVICYPADNPAELCLRSINYKAPKEDGEIRYYTRDAYHEDDLDSISKDKIVAVATGYNESVFLGKFITFTKSVRGIILEFILPLLLLIIMLCAKIAAARNRKEEEAFYDFEGDNSTGAAEAKNAAAPLFDNTESIQMNDEFERKKQSIAENFSQKKVNPDSPYQKEKERTMQFKALRASGNTGNIAAQNASSAAPAAPAPVSDNVSEPVSDEVKEAALRKTAEAENTGVYTFKQKSDDMITETETTVTPGLVEKTSVSELAAKAAAAPKAPAVPASQAAPAAPAAKETTPDISDIIKKSETNRKKKDTSAMSVDDLLKIIENEKKKL